LKIEQAIVFGTLVSALILFVSGRWRYDVVALLALLVVTITGIVPADEAFNGFGHPAVVTVAAVLVVSRGLLNSGLVDMITRRLTWVGDRPSFQVASLTGLVTSISGFVSSMAAAAIMMPVAMQMARKSARPPSILLMPLAFGSLLGATLTLIGSAPNIIISSFRLQASAEPFQMFDYTPVGAGVALAGILFISLIGWRLIPQREGEASREELFQIEDYITEVRVPENFQLAGRPLRDLEQTTKISVIVVGIVRNNRKLLAPSGFETMRVGDILLLEVDSEKLKTLTDLTGLELVGSQHLGEEAIKSDEVAVIEAVIMPDSIMVGRTIRGLNLRWRYGVNVLAVARQGRRLRARLRRIRLRVGDVLLLQVRTEAMQETLQVLGCLPLAERGLRLGQRRRVFLAFGIFGAALAATAFNFLPVQVAFVCAAVAMVLFGILSLGEAYDSINWPIIILLGAMIPVGQSLETTGGAQLIASTLLGVSSQVPPVVTLAIVLVATMFLSDVINNAATAVLMAPIAINVAQGLDASADPFLIAVAVGASCAFLTPIGHQSNTLVMGPGGYRFTDYWRMGLPLEIVIAVVAIPLILWIWPLYG
jgi:di/tricarboxylate transporter